MKCWLARVSKSSMPLSVMTSWRTGAVCQSSVPPRAVSWKDTLVAGILPLSRSPFAAGLELDRALLEVRFRVVARPQADTLDHAGLLAPP